MGSLAPNRVGYPGRVMIHTPAQAARRATRTLLKFAVSGTLAAAVLVMTATPALADPPEQWNENEPVATLDALLIIGIIPIGLVLLITLLTYLPSMIRGQRYEPGLAWRDEPEWFGGPRGGVEASKREGIEAGTTAEAGERGGASANW